MILPLRRFMKSAYSARMVWNAPFRFTASTRSNSSGLMRRASLSFVMPALFTSTSTGPRVSLTLATAAATCS